MSGKIFVLTQCNNFAVDCTGAENTHTFPTWYSEDDL